MRKVKKMQEEINALKQKIEELKNPKSQEQKEFLITVDLLDDNIPRYKFKGWDGNTYNYTAEQLDKRIKDDSKSNYNWIASSAELVKVIYQDGFPENIKQNIMIAILRCFVSLGKGVTDDDSKSCWYCYNNLDISNKSNKTLKKDYLKIFINKYDDSDGDWCFGFESRCENNGKFKELWRKEQFDRLKNSLTIDFQELKKELKKDFNSKVKEMEEQCPFKKYGIAE